MIVDGIVVLGECVVGFHLRLDTSQHLNLQAPLQIDAALRQVGVLRLA